MQVSIEKILAALDQITHAVPCRRQGGNEVHLTVKPGSLTIYKEYDGAVPQNVPSRPSEDHAKWQGRIIGEGRQYTDSRAVLGS